MRSRIERAAARLAYMVCNHRSRASLELAQFMPKFVDKIQADAHGDTYDGISNFLISKSPLYQ